MKKILSILLLGTSLSAGAQQIQGDFDDTWNNCYPWVAGANITTARGTEPQGWHGSNVNGVSGTGACSTLVTQTTGRSGSGYAVQMQNVWVGFKLGLIQMGAYAPGYLTLGTPWNASKGTKSKDGGTFGGLAFAYKPDAVTFYYKWDMTTESKASFIGYLWKGTTSQESVPAETTSGGAPTTVTMTDRDRNILGKETSQGGTVTNNSTLIASFEEYITTAASDWTQKTIDFTYKTDDTPEKINLIFCSTDYFNSTVPSAANALTIDDVKLVYYHSLTDLKYDGTTISGFAEGTTTYDLSSTTYDANKLTYTKKGRGATVETSYDDATALLTITVKGNDYAADNTSKTTYTVQFKRTLTLSDESAASYTAQTYHEVVVNRTFEQGWNTICLPFDYSATEIASGAKAQAFQSVTDGQSLNFEAVSDQCQANTPYLLYVPANVASGIKFQNKEVKALEASQVTYGDYTLAGVYAKTNMEGLYGVTDIDGVQKIVKGGQGSSIKGMRAYFKTTAQNANGMRISFDGGAATGIIDAKGHVTENGAVYNLQGIRVARSAQGLAKGVYIQNGRKFIVK